MVYQIHFYLIYTVIFLISHCFPFLKLFTINDEITVWDEIANMTATIKCMQANKYVRMLEYNKAV